MVLPVVVKRLDDKTLATVRQIQGLMGFEKANKIKMLVFFCHGAFRREEEGIVFVKIRPSSRLLGIDAKIYAYALYRQLRELKFDAAIVLDATELSYYCLLARRQGLAFEGATFVCLDHQPSGLDPALDFDRNLEGLNVVEMAEKAFSLFDRSTTVDRLHHWNELPVLPEAIESVENVRVALSADPLVSVCIVHYNRPQYIAGLLECFRSQTYQNFEIILVDDGSTHPEAIACLESLQEEFDSKGWQIIRQQNKYLGAARNAAARAARGEYIVFSDDDNYPMDHELETFVSVMERTQADILTCGANLFFGSDVTRRPETEEYLNIPLGNLCNSGFYENVFGDANCCVRMSAFEKSGGFTEDYGVGYEDWEFFFNASLQGFNLMVIPESLFWYRIHPGSMMETTGAIINRSRVLRSLIRTNEMSHVLQLANIDYIRRNSGGLIAEKWPLLSALVQFFRSRKKGKLISNLILSFKTFGLSGVLTRIQYFGKVKL